MNPFDAECRKRKIPTNLFFDYEEFNPREPSGQVPQVIIDACQHCEIRITCLDWALQHESHGYWALTRRNARNKLRKDLGTRLIKTAVAPPWWVDT